VKIKGFIMITPELLQRENQKLEHLFELASILSQQTDFQEILSVTAQKAASWLLKNPIVVYFSTQFLCA